MIQKPVNLFALQRNCLVSIFYEFLLKCISEQTIVLRCFKIKIQTIQFFHLKSQLLQTFCKRWIISKIEIVKFELSSYSKIFDLTHSTVLSMFQKKLCYCYNNLGAISFEYIAGVTADGKFSGSLINQSTQIVLMDQWTNDSLCC